MADKEPTHLDAIKWPKKCATCGEMVDKTGWLFEHSLYCEAHKPSVEGATGGGVSNASKEDKALSSTAYVAKVRCPLTQRFFAESDMVTVYTHEHLPLRVSQLAVDIITVQYWAKIEGLWTVPRKAKETVPVEAKA